VKRFKNIAFWTLVAIYVFAALSFAAEKRKQLLCSSVEVNIFNDSESYFIEKDDVITYLLTKNGRLLGANIHNINLATVERQLNEHSAIKNAEVFTSNNGQLSINIVQREPIVRVICNNNAGFYIDADGEIMSLSKKHSARILLANGKIECKLKNINTINLLTEPKENQDTFVMLRNIFKLAKFINDNDFWHSQIAQLYVNSDYEFELVPRIGEHLIIFGNSEDIETKFEKLEHFYKKAMKYVGWEKYKLINLKFENQIVCTKK